MQHSLAELQNPQRMACGYVVMLPGIEGFSRWNRSVLMGLADAGVPFGMEIHDWTARRLFGLNNLMSRKRHHDQREIIAAKIARYREAYPTQPVWLMGHSGGGGMTMLTLDYLPDDLRVTGGILLGAAISPGFDYSNSLRHTERGIWNVSSWGDLFFLAFGTLLCGTIDRKHHISAGNCGFRQRDKTTTEPKLTELSWRPGMIRDGHFAGHFGFVNRRFVKRWIAPIIHPQQHESLPE